MHLSENHFCTLPQTNYIRSRFLFQIYADIGNLFILTSVKSHLYFSTNKTHSIWLCFTDLCWCWQLLQSQPYKITRVLYYGEVYSRMFWSSTRRWTRRGRGGRRIKQLYRALDTTSMCKPTPPKATQWSMRPAKTQISLGVRPVWSESSLSAWRKLGFLATHWAHSEDWSDWADAQANLSLRWAHMPLCWFCHAFAHFCKKMIPWRA